jgi:hypothetical protein
VHDLHSSDAITRSTAKIGRREWWKCTYFIDKRYKNHEKFLKVFISIYMFTLVHFMELQFGLELCLLSQILKKLLLFILEHNPVKCDNCAFIIDRLYILKENRIRYLCKYYIWKWFLIWGKITLKYYISIYEIGPVKSL